MGFALKATTRVFPTAPKSALEGQKPPHAVAAPKPVKIIEPGSKIKDVRLHDATKAGERFADYDVSKAARDGREAAKIRPVWFLPGVDDHDGAGLKEGSNFKAALPNTGEQSRWAQIASEVDQRIAAGERADISSEIAYDRREKAAAEANAAATVAATRIQAAQRAKAAREELAQRRVTRAAARKEELAQTRHARMTESAAKFAAEEVRSIPNEASRKYQNYQKATRANLNRPAIANDYGKAKAFELPPKTHMGANEIQRYAEQKKYGITPGDVPEPIPTRPSTSVETRAAAAKRKTEAAQAAASADATAAAAEHLYVPPPEAGAAQAAITPDMLTRWSEKFKSASISDIIKAIEEGHTLGKSGGMYRKGVHGSAPVPSYLWGGHGSIPTAPASLNASLSHAERAAKGKGRASSAGPQTPTPYHINPASNFSYKKAITPK